MRRDAFSAALYAVDHVISPADKVEAEELRTLAVRYEPAGRRVLSLSSTIAS